MWRPPQNPLEEAIAPELTGGKVYVLDRRDLAKRAALDTLRQAVDSSPARSPMMAADHERAGDQAGAAALREAQWQIRTLPADLP
jgi:hypothetical protein